ncbi:MAG: DUF1574 family protein [Treponema sp.]|nr:DUF1574 family protein [Treponema sp.]
MVRSSRVFKLLLVVFLFLLPVIAVKVYIAKYPLRWCNETGVKFVWARNFVREKQENYYRVVTIGDSDTNAAFAPELLGEDVLDLAVHASNPSDAYYVFKEYLSHNQIPETVYIAFYPWHFRYISPGSIITGTAIMTNLFNMTDELEYLSNARKYGNVYRKDIKGYFDYRFFSIEKYWVYLRNSGYEKRFVSNKTALSKQNFHRGTATTRCVAVYNPQIESILNYLYGTETEENSAPKNWRHFTVSDLQDFYYRKLLALCREQGIFIRILALPQMYANYGEKYWDEFKSYHEKILAGYNAWSFDTSRDLVADTSGFTAGDFADPHHMNNHGSLKFSRMIRERYPEDFAEGAVMPVSDNTLAGLEDYLCMENQADKILQWIQGTGRAEGGVPLSALFITRNDHALEEDWQLAAVLQEEYPAYAESMRAFGKDCGACYFTGDGHTAVLSADGGASALSFSDSCPGGDIGLTAFDDGRSFRIRLQTMENGQPCTEGFSSKDGTDLFVLVFNNRTGTLVTSKSFHFTGWSYKLQE